MLIIGAIGLTAAFLIAALAVITDSPALAIIGVFGVVTSLRAASVATHLGVSSPSGVQRDTMQHFSRQPNFGS